MGRPACQGAGPLGGRRAVEAGHCGDQASGRNGGFASASLTHGFANGQERWPDELGELDRLGAANLAGIAETVRRHGIDCHWEHTGELTVATAPHQVEDLVAYASELRAAGHDVRLLDRGEVRAAVASPTYAAGLWDRDGTAMVEPARLAWGLRQAVLDAGVRVYEGTEATAVERRAGALHVRTPQGEVRARQVLLGTNAFPSLLRRLRLMTVPVYDYVLMTEPLSAAQKAAVGWDGRQGVGDASNMFHYYRLTRDDRILWGGYDAVYHYGSRIDRSLEQGRDPPAARAALLRDLPAARGPAVHPPLGGRHRHLHPVQRRSSARRTTDGSPTRSATPASGSRPPASAPTSRSTCCPARSPSGPGCGWSASEPLPFPPEPLRYAGVQLTRWSLARADERDGRRNLWLRALDRAGLGFDS